MEFLKSENSWRVGGEDGGKLTHGAPWREQIKFHIKGLNLTQNTTLSSPHPNTNLLNMKETAQVPRLLPELRLAFGDFSYYDYYSIVLRLS